jgi:isoleucyl-tRNA synthetase
VHERTELDRWILSELNSLILSTDQSYAEYEPTRSARAIQEFVSEHLSNWYVRLSRRRFWKGEYTRDKIAAYQTLYTCLDTLARLMAPIAPFFADRLFRDLNEVTGSDKSGSVHLALFPETYTSDIDKELEEKMMLAQNISSMVLSLRKKVGIKVRQPLNRIMIPATDASRKEKIMQVKDLILAEVNVKTIEFIDDDSGIIKKRIKPDFKKLGQRVGPLMKQVAAAIQYFDAQDIENLEQSGARLLTIDGTEIQINTDDVEIISEDIPGWQVANIGKLTVALDTGITDALKEEGIARELVNKIQNLRKDMEFEVTDRILLRIREHDGLNKAVMNNLHYICNETLASSLEMVKAVEPGTGMEVEVADDVSTVIIINKQ